MKELTQYVQSSQKMMTKVIPALNSTQDFEPRENLTRSLKVLYEGGLISKRKYQSIRNSEVAQKRNGCFSFPAIAPYNYLVQKIKTLNSEVLTEVPRIQGCKRDLEQLLLTLSEMYFLLDDHFGGKVLHWFGRPRGSFVITIGADGAPFGKFSTGTSLLVGFANTFHRLASRNHNFLVIGGNTKEDSEGFLEELNALRSKMEDIESKSYHVREQEVTFQFEILPSDQKWLATAAGELPNSSTFPSSFANVKQSNMATIGGSIGPPPCTWQQWEYSKRLKDAASVEVDKVSFANKKNPRPLVLQNIAKRDSRQEFVPPLGKFVDFAYPEPLHNKNNAWQHWNKKMIEIAISLDQKKVQQAKSISELPECAFTKYMWVLKHKVKAKKLHYRISKWFVEKSKVDQLPQLRFTGEESAKFSKHFMEIVSILMSQNEKVQFQLYIQAFIGLQLRESVSLFSRFHIDEKQLALLSESCRLYFNAHALFRAVNLTIWTIGYAIPHYARILFGKYG